MSGGRGRSRTGFCSCWSIQGLNIANTTLLSSTTAPPSGTSSRWSESPSENFKLPAPFSCKQGNGAGRARSTPSQLEAASAHLAASSSQAILNMEGSKVRLTKQRGLYPRARSFKLLPMFTALVDLDLTSSMCTARNPWRGRLKRNRRWKSGLD